MRRFFGGLILSAFLITPVTMLADDHDRDDHHRYYDPYRRDYHEWNEREARAYRHWLEQERRRQYHDWEHASRREQRDYWRWRHNHSDWDDRR